jgi:hypothetical protein
MPQATRKGRFHRFGVGSASIPIGTVKPPTEVALAGRPDVNNRAMQNQHPQIASTET